jgi:gamma-glutamyltranspeptidase / glutathione hydrolase
MRSTVALVAIALATLATRSARAADPPPVTTSGGVVAADHAEAAEAGARVLAAGGNAVDAAVATALALGVVNPTSSGVGGGGFALVFLAREGVVHAVDFREVAPAAAEPSLFTEPLASRRGGLAVGVPGELAGLELMIDRWGTRSWRRAVAPAIRLARDGFSVSQFFTRAAVAMEESFAEGQAFAAMRAFLGGLATGATLTRPSLAATLATIAAEGARAFYRGALADELVATVRDGGGVMTADDLARYRAIEREPLWGTWRGYKLATMPLPSSGGVVLLEALAILDATGIDLAALGPGSAAYFHVINEVLAHAFADRARLLGDTGGAAAAIPRMLDPARLAALAKRVDLGKPQPHDRYGGELGGSGGGASGPALDLDDHGTSHLCVVDAEGNAVALTSTVNGYFGSGLLTPGGVVLNNQIDDFSLASGVPNMFGLVQSDENLVGGGKRPLSSMSPTLVFDATGTKVVACVGGSGGPRIISATLQVLIGALALGLDAAEAVGAPRIHQQWTPAPISVYAEVAPDTVAALKKLGHEVVVRTTGEGSIVQLVRIRDDGTREAASDPRKGGRPATAD